MALLSLFNFFKINIFCLKTLKELNPHQLYLYCLSKVTLQNTMGYKTHLLYWAKTLRGNLDTQ